jgi:hypothetical protein
MAINVLMTPDEVEAEKRGPTISERLRARKCYYVDETTDPGENDSLSFPKQVAV